MGNNKDKNKANESGETTGKPTVAVPLATPADKAKSTRKLPDGSKRRDN